MNNMNDLKIKAFEIRHQIDLLETQKNQLIQKYNKIIVEIDEIEKSEQNKTNKEK